MKKKTENSEYLAYGIPLGLLLGTAVAVITSLNIGVCAGVGMLLGIVGGAIMDEGKKENQPSKEQSEDQEQG